MNDIVLILTGISSRDEYALRALVDLAQQPSGIPVRIAKISERQQIPQKFLELILVELKRGGLVESWRGANGGYSLVRSPEELTAGEALRCVKGAASARNPGSNEENPFTELWEQINARIWEILDRTTLSDIVRRWQEKQRGAIDWVI